MAHVPAMTLKDIYALGQIQAELKHSPRDESISELAKEEEDELPEEDKEALCQMQAALREHETYSRDDDLTAEDEEALRQMHDELYVALRQEAIESIDKDIPRTAGRDLEVAATLGVVRSMLLRHATEDPELGYCQGMNMVAALFAVAAPNERDAYEGFRGLVGKMRGLWLPGFPLLREGKQRFIAIAKTESWFQHLESHGIDPEVYLAQAWMTLFATWLPLSARVLFLPHLERDLLVGIVALSLAALEAFGPHLLKGTDVEEILNILRRLREWKPDVEVLLPAMNKWLRVSSAGTVGQPQASAQGPSSGDSANRRCSAKRKLVRRTKSSLKGVKASLGHGLLALALRQGSH